MDHTISIRWFTPDPAEQFANPYLAMGNNPVMYVDPDGQFIFTSAMIIGAMIGAFTGAVTSGYSGADPGQIMTTFGIGALAGAVSSAVGQGVNVALANGSFGAGFWGTATGVSSTGFISGAATGAATGVTNGFITGFGNQLLNGDNIGSAFNSGINQGWKQGVGGSIIGGVVGGLDALSKGVDFFSGKASLNLSSGFGAYNVPSLDELTGKYVGQFEGINIYESSQLGEGYGSGGITLPGRGITVGKGAFSRNLDPFLVKHEFGHILQAKELGIFEFYTVIAPSSLGSAARSDGINYFHNLHWTETSANRLSFDYFNQPNNWPFNRFPLSSLSADDPPLWGPWGRIP